MSFLVLILHECSTILVQGGTLNKIIWRTFTFLNILSFAFGGDLIGKDEQWLPNDAATDG